MKRILYRVFSARSLTVLCPEKEFENPTKLPRRRCATQPAMPGRLRALLVRDAHTHRHTHTHCAATNMRVRAHMQIDRPMEMEKSRRVTPLDDAEQAKDAIEAVHQVPSVQ